MEFIAFDLETTGTVAGVDRIVEIGAVHFDNENIKSVYSTLVDPQRPIPPGASQVNGITDDMVAGKPTIDRLLDSFGDFCQDLPLVAHNAPFDVQFLVSDIRKFESKAPRGTILDTLPMARKILPGLANYKLATIGQHLSIPATNFHRAEEDAAYCGKVFLQLVRKIDSTLNPPISNLVALTSKAEMRFPQIERQPKQLDLLL